MTSTTRQQLTHEEDKLLSGLNKTYQKIQRDLDNGASWNEVQALYHKQTDDMIRSAVGATYEISARKTVERDVHIPYYLTQQDLLEIRRLSQKYQDSFWLALNREITARSSLGIKTYYDPKTMLLIKETDTRFRQGFISRIASSVHGEVAGAAVLSKARQVVLPVQHRPRDRNRFRQAAVGSGQELMPHLTWQTADDEIACAQCLALQGTTYAIDDPDTPVPSDDTHPRCRCQLILEDASFDEEFEETEELFF